MKRNEQYKNMFNNLNFCTPAYDFNNSNRKYRNKLLKGFSSTFKT